MTDKLRLKAAGEDDLKVISSALQDAITRIGDINYAPKARALTLRLTRFRHEDENASQRILTALRIDGVLSLKTNGITQSDPDAMTVLLSIVFEADDEPPGGKLHLIFAGGGALLAHVECLDVLLADMSDPRQTDKLPLHPVSH